MVTAQDGTMKPVYDRVTETISDSLKAMIQAKQDEFLASRPTAGATIVEAEKPFA